MDERTSQEELNAIYKQSDIEDQIRTAIAIIKNGGTVVYPTETVYGLGADAFSEEAVRAVYELKRREAYTGCTKLRM